MSGNSFGTALRVTTFGESHGAALGVVIDGLEAGFRLDQEALQRTMDRRRPGANKLGTTRNEADAVQIISGLFEGLTTGAPLSMIVYNTGQRSNDYENIANLYRPGHGDWTWQQKFGLRDWKGGGRSSGRETASRVAAGAVALQILHQKGIDISAGTIQVGDVQAQKRDWDIAPLNPLNCPDEQAAKLMRDRIEQARNDQDSVGGIIECVATGLPVGLGEPVFDKLGATLAHAMLSIGAVKGIEFGDGFECARMTGSRCNDEMSLDDAGNPVFLSNHAGGLLGGMSSGAPLLFRVAVKPTPSISRPQQTIDTDGRNRTIEIHGRHDPCICPRAVVVVESMTAITLLDAWYASYGRLFQTKVLE
ncbi:MAG: chorismate synthase [Sphaerochaetaceae bacterium]|nr:chorismate synthase [Sphaerochaetaceae bacterium]